ncbi:MAG: hypothetical protein IPI35_24840 [Deltaproteobacteria bacterium]|nr:hypothetical protein [Deltaproteobacteria bacterium]
MASLVDALCRLKGCPPEEAAAQLDEILTSGQPWVGDPHKVLYETFRSFAFTRTQAAWPYISQMTAEYIEQRKTVDTFFRRMGWLLERCEDEDVALLREAFVWSGDVIAGKRKEVTFDRQHHSGITWSQSGSMIKIEPTHLNQSQDRSDVSQTVDPNGDSRGGRSAVPPRGQQARGVRGSRASTSQ